MGDPAPSRAPAPLTVGISGSYGGLNLGDEAILAAIVEQLRGTLPVGEIVVFTRDAGDTAQRHPIDRALPVREMTRRESAAEVARLDLLILGGGGILYDEEAATFLREVALAREAEVPVVTWAISAGPLTTEAARLAVREQLEGVELITVRDRHAVKLLEEIGLERPIELTADPALLLAPGNPPAEALREEGLEDASRLIAFSVREPGPAAPDLDTGHYHALLAHAADFMAERFDADIVFVPMERRKMDVQHSHAVISRMSHAARAHVLKGRYQAPELLALFERFSFAVGMRLHFLIFAALHEVPFVALPYASKVSGFVEELGLEVPPLEQVEAGRLLAHLDRSWDRQDELRTAIRNHLPGLQERARRTAEHVAALFPERAAAKGAG